MALSVQFLLRLKPRTNQRLPEELQGNIISFHNKNEAEKQLRMKCNKLDMDVTLKNFDMPPSRMINPAGGKSILIKTTGNGKSYFTVVLACLADGTKLKLMIIFKRKTMLEEIPPGVLVYVHEKGWMSENEMKLWIQKVLECCQGGHLKKKACLIYDSFRTHLIESIKIDGKMRKQMLLLSLEV